MAQWSRHFVVEDVEGGYPAAQGDDVGDGVGVADVLVAQPASDCASAEFVVDQDEVLGGLADGELAEKRVTVGEGSDDVADHDCFPGFVLGGQDDVALFGGYQIDAVADAFVGLVEQGVQWCDGRVDDRRECLGVHECAGVAFESDLFGADADGVGTHVADFVVLAMPVVVGRPFGWRDVGVRVMAVGVGDAGYRVLEHTAAHQDSPPQHGQPVSAVADRLAGPLHQWG